jgi:hypothetical protein
VKRSVNGYVEQNVGQCSITLYQTMFIDSISGAIAYNTGSPYGATNQLEIDIDNGPVDGLCTSVKVFWRSTRSDVQGLSAPVRMVKAGRT